MSREILSEDIRINKKYWNEIARRKDSRRTEFLRKICNNYTYLDDVEPRLSIYLKDIKGKRIIVPQFGDGAVMLACAKMGAAVTGVDFSREQIRLAKEGSKYCGVQLTLVEADWQHLPKSVQKGSFDFAVTECGIFIWIRDLKAWMKSAFLVLKRGGRLVVTDFHPFGLITKTKGKKLVMERSYFEQSRAINHLTSDAGDPPSHEYLWKLSDVVNAAAGSGFKIDRIEEFCVTEEQEKIPLLPTDFLLAATKE